MPTTSVSRVVAAPQPEVWSLISDIARARRWNSSWNGIEITSDQTHGAGTTFRAHTEEGHEFDFEITGWNAPEYIEFSPVREESERYSLTLDSQAFHLQPMGEGETRVELEARASMHGPRGLFYGLFFWRGHQKSGLNAALDGLQAALSHDPARTTEPMVEPTLPSD